MIHRRNNYNTILNRFNNTDMKQVSEEVERALAKLGPATGRLNGRSKNFFTRGN